MEPLLDKLENRFVLFPIKYHDVWAAYKNHQHAFWTAEEIDFSADKQDWESLTPDEREFISHVLAFFAGSDGIVFENISLNFAEEIQVPEIRCYYGFQAMMENIHSETYSLMIDTYITNEEEKKKILNGIVDLPGVKKKADWACKWLDKSIPFQERLIAFAIVEGVFFSGSFCSIFWLKYSRGKMTKALCKSNELISRDESLHTEFAVLLYSHMVNKVNKERVYEMFRGAVEIEKEFICDSLKCNLLGMNNVKMCEYIEYVSDRLLVQLGYERLYSTKNPFSFMDSISLDGKTNFFEQRVTEYNRSEQIETGNMETLDEF